MPIVNIRENDSFDVALRRFKRACEKAGVLSKLRAIEHFEKPTTERKRKKAAARKRELKRLKKEQLSLHQKRARRFNFDASITKPSTEASNSAATETVTADTE